MKTHLSRLISEALAGEEIIIARGKEREFGCAEGVVEYIAEDFDAPLDDFREYLE
jgi:hypothetical protein